MQIPVCQADNAQSPKNTGAWEIIARPFTCAEIPFVFNPTSGWLADMAADCLLYPGFGVGHRTLYQPQNRKNCTAQIA